MTDVNLDNLITQAKSYIKERNTTFTLLNDLADAVVKLQEERDDALDEVERLKILLSRTQRPSQEPKQKMPMTDEQIIEAAKYAYLHSDDSKGEWLYIARAVEQYHGIGQ